MSILLKLAILLIFIFNVIHTISKTTAFTYSTTSNNDSSLYFRSAKKIAGATSLDPSKPAIPSSWKTTFKPPESRSRRYQSSNVVDEDDDDEDEEVIEPGKMRVSEIKAELDLRDVSYKDCFDKESLVERLQEARATGKANPKILEKFNKQKLKETFDPAKKVEVKDEDIARAVANDGKLPGGLSPDQFKKLASNPEIMSFLQSTKVQDAMQLMMTGGREELENKVRGDPEMQETLKKLDALMKGALA